MHVDMRGPDGTLYRSSAIFKEVVPPEKILFVARALDIKGEPMFEILTTVTLVEERRKTKLTLHSNVLWIRPEAAPMLAGMKQGRT